MILFEAAWEVCNQVGGIYTVIKTKVPAMTERWGDNYFLIGPYNQRTAAIEFEEAPVPAALESTIAALRKTGLPCYVGRWLIPGRPYTILLDYRPRFGALQQDKYFLWKDHGISTNSGDQEVDDAICFGSSVYEFFKEFSQRSADRQIIAHFHEWQTGVAIPIMAKTGLPIARVFTTHATLLGRYMASDNPNFYSYLDRINPDHMAQQYNIVPRFGIERLSARMSTIFTTVSDITAREAERFLGRKPDLVTPNGINIQRFTALHEFQNLHLKYKEKIHDFVMGHFFPSYTFDLDRTIYIFTSGRYEYRNKGIDVFIEMLYRLNQRLRDLPNAPTVVAFIITKAPTRNVNINALQNHLMFDELKLICAEAEAGMRDNLIHAAARGRFPSYEELIPGDLQARLKRAMHALKTEGLPGIATHDLGDDANDAVLKHLRHRGLFNQPSDRVKVVFHPAFLSATGPLLSLDYDQFVRGCHMGVFPSSYEPWGYTPLECIALGIPSVTTDLSGFGGFVQKHIVNPDKHGIYVLNRTSRGVDQSIEDLTNHVLIFSQLSRRERIELRNRAERLTELFDWSVLARHYHTAHDQALEISSASLTAQA